MIYYNKYDNYYNIYILRQFLGGWVPSNNSCGILLDIDVFWYLKYMECSITILSPFKQSKDRFSKHNILQLYQLKVIRTCNGRGFPCYFPSILNNRTWLHHIWTMLSLTAIVAVAYLSIVPICTYGLRFQIYFEPVQHSTKVKNWIPRCITSLKSVVQAALISWIFFSWKLPIAV